MNPGMWFNHEDTRSLWPSAASQVDSDHTVLRERSHAEKDKGRMINLTHET